MPTQNQEIQYNQPEHINGFLLEDEVKKDQFDYVNFFDPKNKKSDINAKLKVYAQVLIESIPLVFSMVLFPIITAYTYHTMKGIIKEVETVSLGLAINYQVIFGLFPGLGIGEMVGIYGSKAYGQSNEKKFWGYFYMGMFNFLLIFCLFSFPFLYFGETILKLLQIGTEEAEIAGSLLRMFTGPTFIVIFNEVIKAGLISQGIETPFLYINLTAFITSVATLNLCSYYGVTLNAVIINTYVLSLTQTILYLSSFIWLGKFKHHLVFKKDLLLKFTIECISMVLNFVFEIVSFHALTMIVGWTYDDAQISSYLFNSSFIDIFYCSNIAISFGYRTRINYTRGKQKPEIADNFSKFFIKSHIILGLLISLILITLSPKIATFFTEDRTIRIYTSNLLKIFCIGFVCDCLQPIIETTIRSFRFSKSLGTFQFCVYGLFTGVLCWYVGIYKNVGVYGIISGFVLGRWIGFLSTIIFAWSLSWEKLIREDSQRKSVLQMQNNLNPEFKEVENKNLDKKLIENN